MTARVPVAALAPGTWALQVDVRVGDLTRACQPEHRDRYGSAGELRPAPDGSAQPVWGATGLRLLVGHAAPSSATSCGEPRLQRVEVVGDEVVLHTGAPLTGPRRAPLPAPCDPRRGRPGAGALPAAGRPVRHSARHPRRPVATGSWSVASRCGGSPPRPTTSRSTCSPPTTGSVSAAPRRGWPCCWSGRPCTTTSSAPMRSGCCARRTTGRSWSTGCCSSPPVAVRAPGSPLAVDAELARVRPDLERWWVVADHSVVVPPGARAVVKHSRPWHEALAGSRWVVTDGALDPSFRRRAGQHVVRLAGYPATTLAVAPLASGSASPRPGSGAWSPRGADQWTTLVVPTEAAEADFRDDVRLPRRGARDRPARHRPAARRRRRRSDARRPAERLGIRPDQVAVLHARHFGDRPTDGRRPVAPARPRWSSATCSATTTSCCCARAAPRRRSSTHGCSTSATTPPRPT